MSFSTQQRSKAACFEVLIQRPRDHSGKSPVPLILTHAGSVHTQFLFAPPQGHHQTLQTAVRRSNKFCRVTRFCACIHGTLRSMRWCQCHSSLVYRSSTAPGKGNIEDSEWQRCWNYPHKMNVSTGSELQSTRVSEASQAWGSTAKAITHDDHVLPKSQGGGYKKSSQAWYAITQKLILPRIAADKHFWMMVFCRSSSSAFSIFHIWSWI